MRNVICVAFVWCLLWGLGPSCVPVVPSERLADGRPRESRQEIAAEDRDASRLEARAEPPRREAPRGEPGPTESAEPRREPPQDAKEPGPIDAREPQADEGPGSEPTPEPDASSADREPPGELPAGEGREPVVADASTEPGPKEPPGPDAGEPVPESPMQERLIPEPPPERRPPPGCAHVPPLTTPKEWLVASGDGASFLFIRDIQTDKLGFLYVLGDFSGAKAKIHTTTLTSQPGDSQLFLAKLDARGNFIWVQSFAGSGHRLGGKMAVSDKGDIFLTGTFAGTLKAHGKTYTSQDLDIFIARFDTCGNLLWLQKAGGKDLDLGNAAVLGPTGDLYVYGRFSGPAQFGSIAIKSQDVSAVFVARLSPAGAFKWVAKGGGLTTDNPTGLGVNAQGEAYIAGFSFGPVAFGATKLNSPNAFEMFVAKLDGKGNWLWAKQTTGPGKVVPYLLRLNRQGIPYITGEIDGEKQFGTQKIKAAAHGDIFLLKMSPSGAFSSVLLPKGTAHTHPYGLAFDSAHNVYIAGDYMGAPIFGSTSFPNSTNINSLVVRSPASARSFDWATRTQTSREIRAQAITVGPKGALFVAGSFQESGTFGGITIKKAAFASYFFVWKIPKP